MNHTCLYSQSVTALWLVLISHPVKDKRLSWPGWLGEIPRWFSHTKMVTHPSISCGGEESNSRPSSLSWLKRSVLNNVGGRAMKHHVNHDYLCHEDCFSYALHRTESSFHIYDRPLADINVIASVCVLNLHRWNFDICCFNKEKLNSVLFHNNKR